MKRSIGDFVGIQTQNLLIRSQMLYSVELRSLFAFASAKIRTSFETSKASGKKSYSDHTQIIFRLSLGDVCVCDTDCVDYTLFLSDQDALICCETIGYDHRSDGDYHDLFGSWVQ